MDIEKALFKLIDFCNANKIEYMITGTVALSMLGIPSEPHDIDIKVFGLNQEQTAKLKELEALSEVAEDKYEGLCYTFVVSGIKVNAILTSAEKYDDVMSQGILVHIPDNNNVRCYTVRVQRIFFALTDKMRLRRGKDNAFMLDLINKLSSL